MTVIKPTVGRVVWYRPALTNHTVRLNDQPHVALVVGVHNDRCINITAWDAIGIPYHVTSVELVQEGDPRPEHGFAEWMPYQIGQAAKHEARQEKPEQIGCSRVDFHLDGADTGIFFTGNGLNVTVGRDC